MKARRLQAAAWLLALGPALAAAAPPGSEEMLGALGMDSAQIADLAKHRPVTFALPEGSADELAVGIAWLFPVPVAEVLPHLRKDNPDLLDVDVNAHGMLADHAGPAALARADLPEADAQALLEAAPGEDFNLSAQEIDSLKSLAHTLKRVPGKPVADAVGQRYRELLFHRFNAYKRGGTEAIAPYAREESLDSKPSLELRQAAAENAFLARHAPALHKAWLEYPKAAWPAGVAESFPWVEKSVENRPAVILRHRAGLDWNGGLLVLTREFYAAHSYNSSDWLTGCMPYRGGTLVFQQVRSYTDQVAGVGSEVKHVFGRELLKDKMVKAFERLCAALGRCP